MHIVLFSGLSESDLTIIFLVISAIHAILALVFAALAIAIAGIFTKRKIAYWPVSLSAFVFGEVCLLLANKDTTGVFDHLFYIYIVVMIVGFTCGIFISLERAKKKDADKIQS